MQNRQDRILVKLKEVKEKGILIANLFNDNETAIMKTKTLSLLRSSLGGKETVRVENGRWYLSAEYFNLSVKEFDKILNNLLLMNIARESRVDNQHVIIKIVQSMSIALVLLCVASYFIGLYDGTQTIEEIKINYPELQCQN